MALTSSTMLPLGTTAPDFELLDVRTGHLVSRDLAAHDARAFLVVFMCAHCPYVVHIEDALAALLREYAPRGVRGVAICANDVASHPGDAPDHLAAQADRIALPVAYLHDTTQQVARAYRAACTPDFFLFGADRKLFYRGRFDASRPSNDVPPSGEDLRAAFEALLAGRPAPDPQLPSSGCNIKWRPDMAPGA